MGFWNESNTAKCIDLYNQGYSGACIAVRIGAISRNAVIGKLHRMGYTEASRNTGEIIPYRQQIKIKKMRMPSKKVNQFYPDNRTKIEGSIGWFRKPISSSKPPTFKESGVTPDETTSFEDLPENGCKHPYGSSPYRYCKNPATHGSYCKLHYAANHTTFKQMKKELA